MATESWPTPKQGTKQYVSEKSHLPPGDHYVIMQFSSIYVPGDERSRTNPGHGYPGRSEPIVQYISFTDKDEWEKEIRGLVEATYGKKEFVALYVKRATISTEVKVGIEV